LVNFTFVARKQRRGISLTTFVRICVDMDFSKGLPNEIPLVAKDYVWNHKLDYENTKFTCRERFEVGRTSNPLPQGLYD
jgi:hypothetical protein